MTRSLRLPIFDERKAAFSKLRHARVLIYWPHGLGDFVHLGTILPALEPTNRYTVTRIGDDFVSLLDGASGVRALHSTVRGIDDGSSYGARHLGVDFKHIENRSMNILLPSPLASVIDPTDFDAILYTDYPEPTGRFPFPRFSKARAAIWALAADRRSEIAWDEPLPNCISWNIGHEVSHAVHADLDSRWGSQARIMLLGLGGHTEPRKAWPLANERELIARWLTTDARNAVVRFQDSPLQLPDESRILSVRTLSVKHDLPFGILLKALLHEAAVYVGVPAGPFHAAMNAKSMPVIGIWQSHHPDWFDEPYPGSRHLVGRWVETMGFEYRPATKTKPRSLRQNYRYLASDIVGVDDVWGELEMLLQHA